MIKVAPAKILDIKTSYQVSGKLKITERWFEVPTDYNKPEAGTIRLFARGAARAEAYPHKTKTDAPWMVYLQGGPGYECKSPQDNAWTDAIINKGYQMLFLDQRGVGLSTPITASTLQMLGAVGDQHAYLKCFRADSIVRDCEAIRKALLPHATEAYEQKWSVMGQSFGGFCCISYLSFYPDGLQEVFIFGGLQPLVTNPDEVYRRLYRKVAERNQAYYTKFPKDEHKVKNILSFLTSDGHGDIQLPSHRLLTVRRFQQLGLALGAHGGLDTVHEIVTRANNDLELFGHLTQRSLREIENNTDFDDALIYSLLHEPIYCEGEAPRWSADRIRKEYPIFSPDRKDGPIYFTGEMIFPWMFEDYAELSKVSEVATRIANDKDWPALFNKDQLGKNTVPVFASVYDDDMYVDQAFAMETANAIRGTRVYRSNVMLHDAVRTKTEETVGALFKLRDDVWD